MNILVTGAKGQLGCCLKDLVDAFGNGHPDHDSSEANYYIFTDYDELDITDKDAVTKFVKENFVNVIVNCAAYTNVEKAQTDRDTAYNVNAIGPLNLAEAAAEVGAILIHISTDYVFKGQRNTPVPPIPVGSDVVNYPDAERDECFYGYSKNIGESLIMNVQNCRYIIIRTAWLYSEYGKNFVKTMMDRAKNDKPTKVVYDQTGSPTYAQDLADFIYHIIEGNSHDTRYLSKCGVYNFANKGVASWYDLARSVFVHFESNGVVAPCRSSEYPSDVIRPAYSVLDTEKTEKEFDYPIPYWHDSLMQCLYNLSE